MARTGRSENLLIVQLAARAALVALLAGLVAPRSASGQEPKPEPDAAAKPWAEGVSEPDQKAAIALFERGNETFGERSYTEALRLYEKALRHWDHPAIRFNISECYIHLDQPVLAFENLEKALAYGDAPLEASIYDRALTNRKLLEGQLAYLEVKSSEGGAQVTLNGEPLLVGVGNVRRVIRPGRHQLVAKKNGRLTQTEELRLLPGETATIEVRLLDLDSVPINRRWAAWKPWVVASAGAAVALGGVGLQFRARSNINKYDSYIEENCAAGCTESELPSDIAAARDSARWQDLASISLIGAGAAAVTTGIVLVILNQPRRSESGPRPAAISLSPTLGRRGAGFAVTVGF